MSETPKDGDEDVSPKVTLPPNYTEVMKDAVASEEADEEVDAEVAPKEKPGRPVKETMVPTTEFLAEFTRKVVADQVKAAQEAEERAKAKERGVVIIPLAELRKKAGKEKKDDEKK